GRIGRNVIIRATGFNMQIYGYDPYVDEEFCKKYRVKVTDLPTLFKESDIITLHAPLTEQTRHMVNRETISLMKKSAFLINTARGELIDEEALFEALKEKKIAGAALDCFSKEPPGRDFPLFKLENALFTPHIGAYTLEANRNMGIMAAKSVVDVFKGNIPENIVNREVLNLTK
ncbi:hypothetical protein H5U35_02675, partial [Candidatus Aerophobetes bacterium]|nr:hypothetical protein [Candidatus Aerophobetes bacterium]